MKCLCSKPNPIVEPTNDTSTYTVRNRTLLQKHLICDDSEFNRLVLKRFITFMGFEVDEASSAHGALDMIVKNGIYQVIWMDYRLSNSEDSPTGADLIRKLRTEYGYKGPIAVVTGYSDEITKSTCLKSGATCFLEKPVDVSEINRICKEYGSSVVIY